MCSDGLCHMNEHGWIYAVILIVDEPNAELGGFDGIETLITTIRHKQADLKAKRRNRTRIDNLLRESEDVVRVSAEEELAGIKAMEDQV